MRLSLCEARSTLGVVTARVRYVPSGFLTSHRINYEDRSSCETGPPVYRPNPRRLESLTICTICFQYCQENTQFDFIHLLYQYYFWTVLFVLTQSSGVLGS